MKITTLHEAFDNKILHSLSASTQIQNDQLSFPIQTFILKGKFSFFNHPNLLFYEDKYISINESCPNPYLSNIDNIHSTWPANSELYFNKYNNCSKKINLSIDDSYILISTQWACVNIFHFLFDAIGKICVIKKSFNLDDVVFFVPEFDAKYKKILKILNLQFIEYSHDTVYYGDFIVPSMPSPFGQPSFDVSQFFKSLSIEPASNHEIYEFVYIGRRSKRAIINEIELIDFICRNRPFKVIYLEDLEIEDQIKIFVNAKFVIAPHGAGLSWSVFQKEGVIIEIHSPFYVNLCFKSTIGNNSAIRYIPYFSDENRTFGSSVSGMEFDNYNVDIEKFDQIFRAALIDFSE